MSALGHEQTSRHVRVMSVLPLKADIHQRGLHVRLVPQADIAINLLALGVGNGRDPFAIPLDHNNLLYAQRAMLI